MLQLLGKPMWLKHAVCIISDIIGLAFYFFVGSAMYSCCFLKALFIYLTHCLPGGCSGHAATEFENAVQAWQDINLKRYHRNERPILWLSENIWRILLCAWVVIFFFPMILIPLYGFSVDPITYADAYDSCQTVYFTGKWGGCMFLATLPPDSTGVKHRSSESQGGKEGYTSQAHLVRTSREQPAPSWWGTANGYYDYTTAEAPPTQTSYGYVGTTASPAKHTASGLHADTDDTASLTLFFKLLNCLEKHNLQFTEGTRVISLCAPILKPTTLSPAVPRVWAKTYGYYVASLVDMMETAVPRKPEEKPAAPTNVPRAPETPFAKLPRWVLVVMRYAACLALCLGLLVIFEWWHGNLEILAEIWSLGFWKKSADGGVSNSVENHVDAQWMREMNGLS